MDGLVVELLQGEFVLGLFAGEVAEEVADGALGGGLGEFGICLLYTSDAADE